MVTIILKGSWKRIQQEQSKLGMSWEASWGRMRNGNGHTKKKNQKKNPMRVTQAWDEMGSEPGENAQWQ